MPAPRVKQPRVLRLLQRRIAERPPCQAQHFPLLPGAFLAGPGVRAHLDQVVAMLEQPVRRALQVRLHRRRPATISE